MWFFIIFAIMCFFIINTIFIVGIIHVISISKIRDTIKNYRLQNTRNSKHRQHHHFTDEMNFQQQQFMDEMNRQQHQQFVNWSMEEAMKSATPFEHGGYNLDHGNSFNDMNHFNNGF